MPNGLCTECTINTNNANAEHEHIARADETYVETQAQTDLRKHKVPTVDVYAVDRNWQYKRFGRSRQVEEVTLLGTGWIVGKYKWEYTVMGYQDSHDEEGTFLTVILDKKAPGSTHIHSKIFAQLTQTPHLARVVGGKDYDEYILLPEGKFKDSFKPLAAEIRRIVKSA